VPLLPDGDLVTQARGAGIQPFVCALLLQLTRLLQEKGLEAVPLLADGTLVDQAWASTGMAVCMRPPTAANVPCCCLRQCLLCLCALQSCCAGEGS
jgi:hypothetical protein